LRGATSAQRYYVVAPQPPARAAMFFAPLLRRRFVYAADAAVTMFTHHIFATLSAGCCRYGERDE